MAKLNHVQLSPLKPSQQEDTLFVEEEVEAGSNDEHTANLINLSLRADKKQTSKNRRPNGGKAVVEILQSDWQSEANMEADEYAEPTHSTSKSRGSTSDLYEAPHPNNSEEKVEAENRARRHTKRSVGIKKAKTPLYSQKPGQPATIQRQTRETAREAGKEPETERIPRSTSRTAAEVAGNESETLQKRPRGRPRKSKAPERSNDPSQQLGEQRIDDAKAVEDDEEEPYEHGISSILLNTSPEKPLPSTSQRPNSNLSISKSHKPLVNGASLAQNRGLSPISDIEEDDEDEEGIVPDEEGNVPDEEDNGPDEDRPEIPEDDADQVVQLPTTLKDVITIKELEDLLESVQRVGQTHNIASEEWRVVEHHPHAYSVPGKRMMRRLKQLIKSYSALPALQEAGGNAVKVNQDSAAKLVAELQEEAEIVFNERLPSKPRGVSRQQDASINTMLVDVYFFLVPNFVEALKLGVDAYQDCDLSETDSLTQIVDLLVLLQKLGYRALQQVQLKNTGYRTSKPTSSALPIIRHLAKKLPMELRRRKQIRRTEARDAGAPERERKRAAEAERESEAKRRRGNEIKREQQRVFNARRNDPRIGHYLQKTEAKRAEAQSAISSQSILYRSLQISRRQEFDDNDDETNDPFADEGEQRSRMTPLLISTSGNPLGTNNASNYRSPNPLSMQEKKIFISTMIFGDKDLRYQLAAERLDRSLDEILGFAKDLQESMDRAHENGKWNSEQDDWTYVIWAEQA